MRCLSKPFGPKHVCGTARGKTEKKKPTDTQTRKIEPLSPRPYIPGLFEQTPLSIDPSLPSADDGPYEHDAPESTCRGVFRRQFPVAVDFARQNEDFSCHIPEKREGDDMAGEAPTVRRRSLPRNRKTYREHTTMRVYFRQRKYSCIVLSCCSRRGKIKCFVGHYRLYRQSIPLPKNRCTVDKKTGWCCSVYRQKHRTSWCGCSVVLPVERTLLWTTRSPLSGSLAISARRSKIAARIRGARTSALHAIRPSSWGRKTTDGCRHVRVRRSEHRPKEGGVKKRKTLDTIFIF